MLGLAPERVDMLARLAAPMEAATGAVFEHAGAGIAILDRVGCVVRANRALAALVAAEVGQSAALMFEDEDAAARFAAALRAALLAKAEQGFTAVLAGSARPVQVTLVPLAEADGRVEALLLRLTDMSVQRGLEQQLADARKMQAVGQLAGGIAHDFNNLLAAISAAAESVTDRTGESPETVEDAREILQAARRGADLVRQLLAFGRQQTLQPRPVEVNAAIRGLSGLLGRLLGRSVRLELDLEEPGRVVRADPGQLDQILVNLAVNARDAMAKAGEQAGVVRFCTTHATLLRPVESGHALLPEPIPAGRYVLIQAEDGGPGILPEVLPRIFEPFFTTRRGEGGTGLGLSTVLGIVRQSGGYLAVDSAPGAGARFSIYLPRWDGALPAAEPVRAVVPSPAASPVQGRTLLLVDDEAPVRRLAERAFAKAGWRVLAAEDGESALARAEAEPGALDLVISDVIMPGMDGAALLERLREARPGLPAILVSGYAAEALGHELAALNVVFIAKPYGLKDLVARAGELVPAEPVLPVSS